MKSNRSHASDAAGSRANPLVRVFCAIELPAALNSAVVDHISRLRLDVPDTRASWEKGDKLHVTLKFFGEISQDKVAVVTDAAAAASLNISPLQLSLNGAGAFHSRGMPKVLWLGIEDKSGELERLHSRLESACEDMGIKREERPFHPHLTIARIRSSAGAKELASAHRALGFEAQGFQASELCVMRSELAPEGSLYSEISRHSLLPNVSE
ncbi:MAG: 2,3-cyclic 3-phosphodiesterase [Acidobacteriota bacterium]|jgi:2'-5' RNA ligase|nr:2,3-cyclic 3-phosphodiesterase [Acidobacteriota bacterium]